MTQIGVSTIRLGVRPASINSIQPLNAILANRCGSLSIRSPALQLLPILHLFFSRLQLHRQLLVRSTDSLLWTAIRPIELATRRFAPVFHWRVSMVISLLLFIAKFTPLSYA